MATKKHKTFKAGDRISWRQYSQVGAGWRPAYLRTGTVWDGAPIEANVTNAWWVVPDRPEPGDAYHAVYVGRARCKNAYYNDGPAPGKIYSSRNFLDITSIMTVSAWRAAKAVKDGKQHAAARALALAA